MWIMYEDENNIKRYINLDEVKIIEISKADIIFSFGSLASIEKIPKDSPAYEVVRNFLENKFEYYGIRGSGAKDCPK